MVKRSKAQRKHIPALSPAELELALLKMQELHISSGAKAQLADMLKAAAHPASQSAEAIIATLDPQRRKDVEDMATGMARQSLSVARRGSKALRGMSEAEFQRLVDEANNGD